MRGGKGATIAEITGVRAVYDMMSDAAFERVGRHLSWSNWTTNVESCIRSALAPAERVERDLKVAVPS